MSGGGESRRRRAGRSGPRGTPPPGDRRQTGAGSKKRAWIPAKLGRISAKRPVLRAVLVFALLMGLFYGVIHNPYVGDRHLKPYLGFIAWGTGGILRILGQEANAHGTSVMSPDFSVEIVSGCDAIEPMAAFAAAVLASPGSLWLKVFGILVGTGALFLINFVRIVSLFFVGVYYPRALDVMHMDVWQGAFIVLAICAWAVWVQWATRTRPRRSRASPVRAG